MSCKKKNRNTNNDFTIDRISAHTSIFKNPFSYTTTSSTVAVAATVVCIKDINKYFISLDR